MAMNPPSIVTNGARREFGNPIIQIILLLIVLILSGWFVLKPKLAQTTQQRNDLKAAQKRMNTVEDEQIELDRLINEMKSSKENIAVIDEALPLNGRISKSYVLLDSLVRFAGMTSALINADDTKDTIAAGDKDALNNPYKPGRSLHTVTVTVSVSGTMEQFRTLLELIETNSRVLDVESINVAGGDAETKFRMTVKTYSYEYDMQEGITPRTTSVKP